MNDEKLSKILNKLEEHFSKPENVEHFRQYVEEELKKPYMTQLQCSTLECEYCSPKGDIAMGTITYCDKYKCNEKGCLKRTWEELILND